jgi:hypothetical protein
MNSLEQNKEKVIERYNSGELLENIYKDYNCSQKGLNNKLKQWEINTRKKPIRKNFIGIYKKEMMKMYDEGLNCSQIAGKLKKERSTVLHWFKVNNLTFSHIPNVVFKYSVDHNFFDKIDTEQKAYLLGLYFSDGNIKNNCLRLVMCDYDIIEKTKNILQYTGPIKERTKINRKISYSLIISSPDMVKNLKKMGCVENKSLILKFPHEFVPKELINHFLRGMIDGDGCICTRKKYKNYSLSIVGTRSICDGFQFNLKCGNIYKSNKKNDKNTYIWRVYNKQDIKECLVRIYKNSIIYMDRKYKKAIEILEEDKSNGLG